MRISRRAFNAVYGLLQIGTAPPGGSASVMPEALAAFAARVSQANKLAARILAEVPPHADKDPADLAEQLAEAEALP